MPLRSLARGRGTQLEPQRTGQGRNPSAERDRFPPHKSADGEYSDRPVLVHSGEAPAPTARAPKSCSKGTGKPELDAASRQVSVIPAPQDGDSLPTPTKRRTAGPARGYPPVDPESAAGPAMTTCGRGSVAAPILDELTMQHLSDPATLTRHGSVRPAPRRPKCVSRRGASSSRPASLSGPAARGPRPRRAGSPPRCGACWRCRPAGWRRAR